MPLSESSSRRLVSTFVSTSHNAVHRTCSFCSNALRLDQPIPLAPIKPTRNCPTDAIVSENGKRLVAANKEDVLRKFLRFILDSIIDTLKKEVTFKLNVIKYLGLTDKSSFSISKNNLKANNFIKSIILMVWEHTVFANFAERRQCSIGGFYGF